MGNNNEPESQELPSKDIFKLASYNLFMLPPLPQKECYKNERLKVMCEEVFPKLDICCFQEIFTGITNRRNTLLKSARKSGFLYSSIPTESPALSAKVTNSGLLTISKYPILTSEFEVYNTCSGVDSIANKGILYSKIKLQEGKYLHLFNTHLQATYHGRHFEEKALGLMRARLSQVLQMTDFIRKCSEKNWVKDEGVQQSVMLCGDFNITPENEFHPLAKLNSETQKYKEHDWNLGNEMAERWFKAQFEEKLAEIERKMEQPIESHQYMETIKINFRPEYILFDEYKFLIAMIGRESRVKIDNLLEKNYYDSGSNYITKDGKEVELGFEYPITGGFKILDTYGPNLDDDKPLPDQDAIHSDNYLTNPMEGVTLDFIFKLEIVDLEGSACHSVVDHKQDNGMSFEIFPNFHRSENKKLKFNRLSDHNMVVANLKILGN